ncbi:MAG: ABC transporter permease [Gemmatales bacterium]|nr:ABC transporter permease [Gemmatales bacterium]MCS7160579.1 ABC transporter permease [Gemmatales bacterium]MDW8175780.1 ABC transporter permease [Gemmatales bacterium]MDW8222430.1 ABC transporter permease [Gemmatales bacterium]
MALLGPILHRELVTLPRRGRHYVLRFVYLAGMWVLAVTAWQASRGWGYTVSAKELADFGAFLFQLLAWLQLSLVIFFAALTAAAAVAMEKDRRTLVLLLCTDLSDAEIVLGKLFGSLAQIGLLLVSALPIQAMLLLLGGVSLTQIVLVFVVLCASGLAAGALGNLIAFWREKTFQTLALTVLCLVLYFLAVEALGLLAYLPFLGRAGTTGLSTLQASLQPFRALAKILTPYTGFGWAATPVLQFTLAMLTWVALLSTIAVWKLRVWNPSGEPIQQREAPEEEEAVPQDVATPLGPVREVWSNPVLWRELCTRSYGRRPILIKLAYLLVVSFIAFAAWQSLPTAGPHAADRLLPALGIVPVLVLSLLLINAQGVTAITYERDLNSLDLLLVTDLTPKEFIFGKLLGVLYNTKEIILPPFLFALAYTWAGYIGWEVLSYTIVAVAVLVLFASMLGLHVGLHNVSTKAAIAYSLGTIFFLFVGTLVCIYLLLVAGRIEAQFTSFLLFLALGIGGMWFVLGGRKPSAALFLSSWLCPLGLFYAVVNVLVDNPYTGASGDPLLSFLVVVGGFGFTLAAMLVPLLSEFDVALWYHTPAEE